MKQADARTNSSPDDGVRGEVAVVVSISLQGGTVRIVFDDAERQDLTGTWKSIRLFTSLDLASLDDLNGLSEKQLADLGMALVARLSALIARQPKAGLSP